MNDKLSSIKHLFMVYRNGIVADALRKAGDPHEIIFGLQLPQIAFIAKEYGQDAVLAEMLWEDKKVRESRLLACRIFPPEGITTDMAIKLASSLQTREEAEIICFYLFRFIKNAPEVLSKLRSVEFLSLNPLMEYCADTLERNLSRD